MSMTSTMTFRVEKAEEGRLLTLDPIVIFDRRKISPKLANKLLQLIDPSLGETAQISGEVSLSVDQFRIPLGIPRDQLAKHIKIEGNSGSTKSVRNEEAQCGRRWFNWSPT